MPAPIVSITVFDMPVQSGNSFLGRNPRGWWGYINKWKRSLDAAINKKLPEFAKTTNCRRHVEITRFFCGKSREMDDDNFKSGCKPIFDWLKRNELIVDDSNRWITRFYNQVRDDCKIPCVLIQIFAETKNVCPECKREL